MLLHPCRVYSLSVMLSLVWPGIIIMPVVRALQFPFSAYSPFRYGSVRFVSVQQRESHAREIPKEKREKERFGKRKRNCLVYQRERRNWALVVLRHRACKKRSHQSVRCSCRVVLLYYQVPIEKGGIADGATQAQRLSVGRESRGRDSDES